jgi:hypothetical protein
MHSDALLPSCFWVKITENVDPAHVFSCGGSHFKDFKETAPIIPLEIG